MKCRDLFEFTQIVDAVMSPGGDAVAYVRRAPNPTEDRYEHELLVAPVPGARRTLSATSGGSGLHAPSWSPDGDRLAAVETRRGQPAAVILVSASGDNRRRLVGGVLQPSSLTWSPDGREVAFLALSPATGAPGQMTGTPRRAPIVIGNLSAKLDGRGVADSWYQHVLAVDCETGTLRQLTHGDLWVDSFCYSPSSDLLAFCGAGADSESVPRQPGTVRPSELWLMNRQGGDLRRLTTAEKSARSPMFTRDGEYIVFVGLPSLRADLLRLFAVSVRGGPVAHLTGGLDRGLIIETASFQGAHPPVTGSGGEVLFCARDGGCVQLYQTSVHSPGSIRVVAGSSNESIGSVSASKNGERLAYVVSAADGGQRVTVLDQGTGSRALVASTEPPGEAFPAEPVEFTARDGLTVRGWLIRGRISGRAPLLVDVHGGSFSGAWSPLVHPSRLYQQELAEAGWTVLLLNARGSDGYGSEFARGALGAWGTADAPDFHDSIDALITRGLVDPARLAITGYSYGGFMSNWLTATSDRFSAAVAGGSICDFVSLFGTSDMGWAMAEYDIRVRPQEDPLGALSRSPVAQGLGVRTPTLLLHGEADTRCPISQAEEWLALLLSNGCEAALVRYPGASHGFLTEGPLSFAVDYGERLVGWVNHHVQGGPASRTVPRNGEL